MIGKHNGGGLVDPLHCISIRNKKPWIGDVPMPGEPAEPVLVTISGGNMQVHNMK
jgi:hypothetical protein